MWRLVSSYFERLWNADPTTVMATIAAVAMFSVFSGVTIRDRELRRKGK